MLNQQILSINKDTTGLLIIDVQGELARLVQESDSLIAHCLALVEAAKTLALPIVWVEQNPDKLGKTTPELQAALTPHQPLAKWTFDASAEPAVVEALNQSARTQWLVCGIEAHICVYQTVLGLKRLGWEPHLVVDATSSRTMSNKQLAVDKIALSGIALTSVEMALYELVKDCRDPDFKALLNLVKSLSNRQSSR
ncbi:isochorismatase family protein [Vibrio cholerae]